MPAAPRPPRSSGRGTQSSMAHHRPSSMHTCAGSPCRGWMRGGEGAGRGRMMAAGAGWGAERAQKRSCPVPMPARPPARRRLPVHRPDGHVGGSIVTCMPVVVTKVQTGSDTGGGGRGRETRPRSSGCTRLRQRRQCLMAVRAVRARSPAPRPAAAARCASGLAHAGWRAGHGQQGRNCGAGARHQRRQAGEPAGRRARENSRAGPVWGGGDMGRRGRAVAVAGARCAPACGPWVRVEGLAAEPHATAALSGPGARASTCSCRASGTSSWRMRWST